MTAVASNVIIEKKEEIAVEDKIAEKTPDVPYIIYEEAQARMERQVKRLWIALIAAMIAIFACNAIWLYCWMQYDYVSDTYTIESQDGGNANFIGNDGDITNGTDRNSEKVQDTENG